MSSLLEVLSDISDVSWKKDQVSSFVADVAGPCSNPDAAEKMVSLTAIPKNTEAQTTQDSNGFKGLCIKKYPAEEIFAFIPQFLIILVHFMQYSKGTSF